MRNASSSRRDAAAARAASRAAAVLDALTGAGRADLTVTHLAVREMPGSGTPAELLAAAGIDAAHIADAARRLLAGD